MAKDRRVHRIPDARQKKAAVNLASGKMTIGESMLDAGYAKATANLGVAGIPLAVWTYMKQEGLGASFMELGKIDATQQEQLVRGRLVYNTIRGKDSGVNSAKALGSDKRVNMFTPESQNGVIIIQGSSTIEANKDKILNG